MKKFTILFTLFYYFNALAVAPYGIKGQQQAATLYSNVHQFPNNQVTNLGGINALVETGNTNILSNPSFESPFISSLPPSWTNSAGTITQELTDVIDGKASVKVVLSSQTMSLTQSSTLYAAQFADGVQGLAMVRIKSDIALSVCSIQAGTVSTTNCVTTSTNNKWGLYKVPFILGGTSNGISISSTGALVTGSVIVDDAFVGAVDLKQDVPLSSAQSSFTVQAVSFGVATITGATTSTDGSGIYSYVSGTGIYTALKKAIIQVDTSFRNSSSLAVQPLIQKNGTDISVTQSGPVLNSWISTSASFSVVPGDTFLIRNGVNTTDNQKVLVSAIESVNTSVYSTPNITNADRIGEIVQTTNSVTPNGFISAMNKSIGQTGSGATFTGNSYFALYGHIWNLAGLTTTAGDVYRISSAKGATAVADFAALKTITIDYETNAPFIRGKAAAASIGAYQGSAAPNISGNIGRIPDATGDGAFLVGAATGFQKGSAGAAQSTVNFDASRSSSVYQAVTEVRPNNVSLFVYIRYTGDSNIIIGSFNGLQSCTDTLACTDTFSASVSSAGVVSAENVDWISGNATVSDTSQYTFSFNSSIFTVAPNCFANTFQAIDVAQLTASASPASSTNFSTRTGYQAAGGAHVKNPYEHRIICQKQGADYIGKTAMAVASDQNVRSIGSTNVDIQSVYFGSGANCTAACTTGACAICTQVGSKITSVSFSSTGNYDVNGIDGTKYVCSGSSNGTSYLSGFHDKSLSTSLLARLRFGSAATSINASMASVTCIGIP